MESERRGPSVRRYKAAIRVGRSTRYLGVFQTEEERDARLEQAREERQRTGDVAAKSESIDHEIDDPWNIPTRHSTPEQRLCAAMLLQTARDLSSGAGHLRSGARGWVLSRAKSFGSFLFCCDTIGMDVGETRRRMLMLEAQVEGLRRIGEGDAWQREPSAPLTLVKKGSAQN